MTEPRLKALRAAVALLSLILGGATLVVTPGYPATDPVDACKDAKAKAAGKKAADLLKAIGKNLKKADPIKLAASISKAQSKLTKSFVKAESKGGCATSGDVMAIEAKTDAFVNDAAELLIDGQQCGNNSLEGTEECDGTDDAVCVGLCQTNCQCPVPTCANGVLEAGEQCDPPCSTGGCGVGEICGVGCTCVPADPCDCGSPDPTTLEFTSTVPNGGAGICGAVKDAGDVTVLDLDCGSGYSGGGEVGVEPKQPSHIGTGTVYKVECCYGTTLALSGTTPVDTGSTRNCSTPGCTSGAPNPVPQPTPPFSTCVFETIDEVSTGWADCSSGETAIRETIQTTIHLTGDELPDRCSGGPNPGGACGDDSDCAPGGTCVVDPDTQACPICNTSTLLCNGGPNDGLACSPGTADLGGSYPTSYDCPPDPSDDIGGTLNPHDYSTASAQSVTTSDGQFCTFCRDLNGENTHCFEGDPRALCPDSATGPCKPQMGQTAECGTPTPCETDADCFPPYETCTQRTHGAFDDPTGRTITNSGLAAGDLTDRMPHAARLASIDCVPPSFIGLQDSGGGFPGPGAYSIIGPMQLKP